MPHDVFISYSNKDKLSADAICNHLEQNGIKCWIAPRDIGPGLVWAEEIVKAITSSKVFVLVFSENANRSNHVFREIERAIGNAIPVIPVRVDPVLPDGALEYFLGAAHWLDAFPPPLDRHFGTLSASISGLLAKDGERGVSIAAGETPTAPVRSSIRPLAAYLAAGALAAVVALGGVFHFTRSTAFCFDTSATTDENDENRVSSFSYSVNESTDPYMARNWSRPTGVHWLEQAMTFTRKHVPVKRIRIGECDGTLVRNSDDEKLELFVPDRNCSARMLRFRRPPDCGWAALPVMTDVQ